MKNLKRLIILVVVGVLALSTLVLSACGSDLDYEVNMLEVNIEEIVKDGETFGCLVAYGQTDKNAKQYGFKIIYSNGTEKFFASNNINSDGIFSARIEGLPQGTYTARAYLGNREKISKTSFGFDALLEEIESVSLNMSSLNLYVGQSYQLTASFTPDNTIFRNIHWSSSNDSIVTVENGLIVGVKSGTATVRASVKDKYKECKVTVTEKVFVSFEENTMSLCLGESKTIVTAFGDDVKDKTLTWSTQDDKIAKVDKNGKVTAVGFGETNVFATTVSGDKTYCKVTVVGEFSITLSTRLVTLDMGASINLGVTVEPAYAIERGLVWYSENDKIATVDQNGKVVAVGKGTTYVYADINGVRAGCEITIKDEFKITFMVDGEIYSVRYTGTAQNYKVYLPEDPEDMNDSELIPFEFTGWYSDSSFTTKVTANTTFRGDVTVYGHTKSIYNYDVIGGKAYITGFRKGVSREDIVIPRQIAGYPVQAVSYNAFKGTGIKSVHIESGVREILDEAFRDCVELDTVTFEKNSTLVKVGDSAFRDCVSLSNIVFPKSLIGGTNGTVGELVFYGAKQVHYGQLYSYNLQPRQYYSNKYVYEFMGEDTMFIGGYIEPSVGYFASDVTLESVIKDWVASGTNSIIGIGQPRWGTTQDHYYQMLDYLEKYGGMMLMKNSIGSFQDVNDPAGLGATTGVVNNYSSQYASFAGFHIEDEPGVSSWVPGLGEYSPYFSGFVPSHMQYTHEIWKNGLTRKLYYVNLLPVNSPIKAFAWGADAYNHADNLDKLWSEYEQYANYDYYYETYVKYVRPEVFSYDFYPLWANGGVGYLQYPTLNQRHFEQLYKTYYYTTEYALQELGHTIPFWNFVQVTSWGDSWGGGSREATYRELVWQINTALAFGSKGYQYFVFTDYGDISGQGGASNYGNCPMTIDGRKGPAYNDVKEANKHSQAMAKWLLNADLDHIYMHGNNPSGEVMPSEILVGKKKGYDWAFESSSGAANIVSHMTYVANNNEYIEGVPADERELYFVCNNGTQSFQDGNITITFDRVVSGSYIFDGVEKTFTGKSLTVKTKAGEGFAILLNK